MCSLLTEIRSDMCELTTVMFHCLDPIKVALASFGVTCGPTFLLLLLTIFTCAFQPGCLVSHVWLPIQDCEIHSLKEAYLMGWLQQHISPSTCFYTRVILLVNERNHEKQSIFSFKKTIFRLLLFFSILMCMAS